MLKIIIRLTLLATALSMSASSPKTFPATGNVGVGTTLPTSTLTLASPDTYGGGNRPHGLAFVDTFTGSVAWGQAAIYTIGSAGYNGNLMFVTDGEGIAKVNPTEKMRILYKGDICICTGAPGAKLEIDGNVQLTSGSGASITFADGTVQSTAYTGVTCGGDYAESMDVTGGRTYFEPGDVLVLDTDNPGRVLESKEAYSTSVSGTYSTKSGVVGRRQTSDPLTSKTGVPMAVVCVVPTKVSDSLAHRPLQDMQ